jgi:ATP-dependent Lhr-like helicase
MVRQTRILENTIFEISPDTIGVALWLGTKASNALDFSLNAMLPQRVYVPHHWPFLIIKNTSRDKLSRALEQIKSGQLATDSLVIPDNMEFKGKYNDFVPPHLLRKQYLDRFVDVDELQKSMQDWREFKVGV